MLDRIAEKTFRRGLHIAEKFGSELHSARKAVKKRRYATEYMGQLYPDKPVRRYIKRCKKLQKLHGRINDADVAVTLMEQLTRGNRLGLTSALGITARWSRHSQEEAQQRLPRLWAKLRATPPFWP